MCYRGYVCNQETDLYYLQSRYYDPELGRFINADALVSTGQGILGNNMFAYCNNNPIRYSDPSGNVLIEALIVSVGVKWTIAIIAVALTIVAGIVYTATEALLEEIFWQWDRSFFEVVYTDEAANHAQIDQAEHTKNKSEKNRNRHEEGQSRKQRDQGGEKKKQKRGWQPNPNKRKKGVINERFIQY